jgi:hypothetical protein
MEDGVDYWDDHVARGCDSVREYGSENGMASLGRRCESSCGLVVSSTIGAPERFTLLELR